MTDEATLFEAPLVPDPDADEELGPGGPGDGERLADEDVKGSRILLVRRAIEPVDLNSGAGAAAALACTFHAAPGARFSFARVQVDLSSPAGAVFLDIAPKEVRANEAVQFTVAREGKIGISYAGAEAGASTGQERTFTVYPCLVRGSGATSTRALWDLRENQHSADGIGHEQVLVLTLGVVGAVEADILINARLIRPGLPGRLDAIRDMILGPAVGSGPRAKLRFEIPEAAPKKRFFGLLGT